MKPNKERIALWVKTLETTTEKQGKKALCKDGAYCCLGIACEVAIRNGLEVEVGLVEDEKSYNHHTRTLPHAVQKWYGLDDNHCSIGDTYATTLNDEDGLTFREIAECVKKFYLGRAM